MNSKPSLETIFRQFNKKLKSFIVSQVGDYDTSDDILQEVYLKVHGNIESLKDSTKLESWLYQITRNSIIDYYRKRKISEPLPDEIVSEELSETAVQKLSETVHQFIEQLPENYRDAIKLTDIEGITQKDLAKRLAISLPGAKSRVQRGRKMLKEMLFECCHFEFDHLGTVLDYHPHKRNTCCPVCDKK